MNKLYQFPIYYKRYLWRYLIVFFCLSSFIAFSAFKSKNLNKYSKNIYIIKVIQENNKYNFSTSNLKNVKLTNPTSLQFGPDNRLYVSELGGLLKVIKVQRIGNSDYTATEIETIDLINKIPNHNDDGALAPNITTRQITGFLVTGTAANPVIYVSSSDSRMGGPNGDLNLDTNSGIVSRITWNGSAWVKVDMIRGLPRSEENHANNGMQLDTETNTLYLAVGGITNAGSPSINFAYLTEFALSAAILSINFSAIEAMPVKGSGNTAYIYDLPTLDDPTRQNKEDGTDINDPFGGNDGLNQAKLIAGGPVQVYASGFRNVYDLVLTKSRQLYAVDNGANQGWGGYPDNEGSNGTVTNKYVTGEPGSTSPGINDPQVNNLDNLHYVGAIDNYVIGSHYGGHPNPIRANPAGAGLYTHNGTSGVWRNSKTGDNPLPQDWPPVPVEMANKIEGDYQNPGETDVALLTFTPSTNGITEYTASNFNNALKGNLLAAAWDGTIFRIRLNSDGTDVLNARSSGNKLNQDAPFASGFGSLPLDVVALGDGDIFPGTVWAVTYGSGGITIFEPQDFVECSGEYGNLDEDQDGFTNADEIDNNTNPCSASSKPADHDGDLLSDLNDPDDDNDGLADGLDLFALDDQNGQITILPVQYELFNNNPGTGLFGVGFTGLMSNQKTDNNYNNLFDKENLIAGGAVGAFTVVEVGPGDALGSLNDQHNGFQFGVNVTGTTGPFTVKTRMLGSFFNNKVPQNNQSQGLYIGTGDQDNYLKITLNANGGKGGVEVVYENNGDPVSLQYELANGIPSSTIDLYLSVDPAKGTVQPKYAADGSQVIVLDPISVSGSMLSVLQTEQAMAVGIISTSRGSVPFTATWDFIYVGTEETHNVPVVVHRINSGGGQVSATSGTFSADVSFSPQPGNTYQNAKEISGTTDDALYHTERYGTSGVFSYALPVVSGDYTVVLHFAELYWGVANQRLFDVSLEGNKVLDNYDIIKKAGSAFKATTESFTLSVTDGTLNIYFSSLATDGGKDQPKISAIEVISLSPGFVQNQVPVANAGPDKTVTLPTNSVILSGSGSDPDGTIASYAWAQVNGPNTASISSKSVPSPTVSGLVEGSYVFSLTVTDDKGAKSQPDQVSVTVKQQITAEPMYAIRINAGGEQLSNSIGTFAADANFSPAPGFTYSKIVGIEGTTDDAMYQTERSSTADNGTFSYNFSVTNGEYQVVLHFAEIYWWASGQRLFDVTAEGVKVLDNYDIYKMAGGSAKAIKETFDVSVKDGQLDLYFSAAAADGGINRPKISAIEIIGKTTEAPVNNTPVANAGPDQTVTANTDGVTSVQMDGSKSTDSDGQITAYNWTEAGIQLATGISPTLVLKEGQHSILLTVTDDKGATASDEVIVTVSSAGVNQTPIANAGPDQAVTLPTNSVILSGSGSDPDGTIASYAWAQVNGPNTASISSKSVPSPTVSGLVEGSYVFSLTVTDDKGAKSQPDQVSVTVKQQITAEPVNAIRINAGGPDVTLASGLKFMADKYYTGSFIYQNHNISDIAGTTDDELYKTERSADTDKGSFSYNIPVANGTYKVKLHFAEIYWGEGGKGYRVFSVNLAGGTVELPDYDIVASVGPLKAEIKEFTVSVIDEVLNINFDATADRPKISAIEVIQQSTSTTQTFVSGKLNTQTAPHLEVYPNPNKGNKVTLQLQHFGSKEILDVVIYDMLGRVVQTTSLITDLDGSANQVLELNRNLNKGVYLVVVRTLESSVQQRLVLQ